MMTGRGNVLVEQRNEALNLGGKIDTYNRDILNRLKIDLNMEELAEELAEKLVEEVTSSRKYNVYFDNQQSVYFYFNRIKLHKGAPSTLHAQIEIREPLKTKSEDL
ncbi:hypothetical protein G6F56_007295 [Rhizopus delemar]|nr:hypothetical protein G6F56_007295 [Rhizopus delemar]